MNRAAELMREIGARHHLHRLDAIGDWSPERLRFVVAFGGKIVFFDYRQLNQDLFSLQMTGDRDRICSVSPFLTNEGYRIAVTTQGGNVYIVDGNGIALSKHAVSAAGLWWIKPVIIRGSVFLLAGGGDRALRILGRLGELRLTIETPGRVLSVDIRHGNEKVIIAGGVKECHEVYLWDLNLLVARRDATPIHILRGGQRPAFCTIFLNLEQQEWIAHGSWDAHIYLYREPTRPGIVSPEISLKASSPVYPLRIARLQGESFMLAGTESGEVQAWRMANLRNGNCADVTLASVGSPIKHMQVMQSGGETNLVTGSLDGCLRVFRLEDRQASHLIAEIKTDEQQVVGIGLIPVLETYTGV